VKKKLCLLLSGIILMLGCTHTARLYPVQGPLSTQTPLPVLFARITGVFAPGDISVVLSDGEVCKGHWVLIHRAPAPKEGAAANVTTANGMSTVWDTVYGPGYYVSHVLGTRLYAQAVVTGNRGTVFNVEMYRSEREHEENSVGLEKGVAKDNKDNLYKLVL
jgi:hypothetical protein